MQIAKLVLFGLLGITACVASPASDPTETDSTDTEALTSSPDALTPPGAAPQAACGYSCKTNGTIELPLEWCQKSCPGGPQNCKPTPPPCP